VKGKAKEWVLSLYEGMKEPNDWMGIPMVEAVQALLTLDDDSAAEVIAVLTDPAFKEMEGTISSFGAAIATFRRSQINPGAVIAGINERSGEGPDPAVQIVFSQLVKEDAARAAGLMEGLSKKDRGAALDAVLGGIVKNDPEAALALAEKYPDDVPEQRQTDILSKLVEKNPLQGMAVAVKLAEARKNGDFLRHGLNQWLGIDKNAAIAWAESYSGPGQTAARAWRIERKSEEDPMAALADFKALQSSVFDPKEVAGTARYIAEFLRDKDLSAAREWALGLPPGPPRDEAVPLVFDRWVRKDIAAASEWISTLPQGWERDNSSAKLAEVIKHRDPPAAFEWARNIQDEDQRVRSLKEVMDVWLLQNEDAAKAAANTLPEKIRKEMPESK
jgi:hypothetical protein